MLLKDDPCSYRVEAAAAVAKSPLAPACVACLPALPLFASDNPQERLLNVKPPVREQRTNPDAAQRRCAGSGTNPPSFSPLAPRSPDPKLYSP
ncbi:unnamed protein product [Arctogadus glacialis]